MQSGRFTFCCLPLPSVTAEKKVVVPKFVNTFRTLELLFWHILVYEAEYNRPVPTVAVQSYSVEVIRHFDIYVLWR